MASVHIYVIKWHYVIPFSIACLIPALTNILENEKNSTALNYYLLRMV